MGYGCDPGRTSWELPNGGVFTNALLQHMGRPMTLQDMALAVRNTVMVGGQQRSWFNDAMFEAFSLSWGGGSGEDAPLKRQPPAAGEPDNFFTLEPGDNPFAICQREFGNGMLYLNMEYYGPLTDGRGESKGRLTEESARHLPVEARLVYKPVVAARQPGRVFILEPGDNPFAICQREFGNGMLYLNMEYYGPLTDGRGESKGRLTEESARHLPDGARLVYPGR
ncbi:hypothetical protein GPECTOR_10g1145 [Gonium pectorale]|uniref:Peptidase C14 caspase domain-containing protein n=1 Tax=Gonium pectorale TaxID=33097 RepID=A0A150GQV1_GONPE|nr:hypothetical protein GPECTOR_10g1145 [Gonium pectorale]|eukprot:KXZ52122.1 hypothetical protein GPECTOR_10g1145 [Gonium pectorale]